MCGAIRVGELWRHNNASLREVEAAVGSYSYDNNIRVMPERETEEEDNDIQNKCPVEIN